MKEKSAEFWGTGYQCKDGSLPSTKCNIYRVWRCYIRIARLYLKLFILALIMAFVIIMYIISAINHIVREGKIDTYSLNCIHFPL